MASGVDHLSSRRRVRPRADHTRELPQEGRLKAMHKNWPSGSTTTAWKDNVIT